MIEEIERRRGRAARRWVATGDGGGGRRGFEKELKARQVVGRLPFAVRVLQRTSRAVGLQLFVGQVCQ